MNEHRMMTLGSVLLALLAIIALGGCTTGERLPDCRSNEIDSTFQVERGERRRTLLKELGDAADVASVTKFDATTGKQFVARSEDRAVVCELSSCTPGLWFFDRMDGAWIYRRHVESVCVVR